MAGAEGRIRLDKWVWQARFFKSRSLASKVITAGHMRVNGERAAKPALLIGPGDTLRFSQARVIRVIRIIAIGTRRGPAGEARLLYEDLSPEAPAPRPAPPHYEGKGRPTKKDRRKFEQHRGAT